MKTVFAVLVLVLCEAGLAATPIYVDPNIGTSGDGTTPATAIKTISEAIDAVDSGGTIKLMAGDYPGHAILIDDAGSAKTMTIESDTTRVKLYTNTTACVLFSYTALNKTVTIRNIEFSLETTGDSFLHFNYGAEGSVILEDCVFTQHPVNKPLCLRFGNVGSAGYSRNVTLRRCTYTSNITKSFIASPCNRFLIDDCNMTFTANSPGDVVFQPNGSVSELIIMNSRIDTRCDFMNNHGGWGVRNLIFKGNVLTHSAYANDSIDYVFLLDWAPTNMESIQIERNVIQNTAPVDSAKRLDVAYLSSTARGVNITGNAITTNMPDYRGNAIYLASGGGSATITNNTIIGFNFCVNSKVTTILIANTLKGATPVSLSGVSNVVNRNTIIAVDGAVEGRAILFERNPITAVSSANTAFTSTSVTDGADWALWTVAARMICITKSATAGPGSYSSTYWGYVVSTGNNRVYVDRWIKVADGTTSTPPNGSYAQVVVFGTNNTVINNIFDAGQAQYCMNFDYMPMDGMNYLDYNCYVRGKAVFGNLGINVNGWGAVASLADQRARWLAFSPSYPLNDAHSLEVYPQIDANYHATNMQLQGAGSPLQRKTDGTVLLLNNIGVTEFEYQVPAGYPPGCLYPSSMDTNHDCKIDMVDFAEFAAQWLTCGFENQLACRK